ncbi:DNA helicase [Tanacetum coccineum]|uniref:ATP-dependent DNA helicase n=1 Tax=Tanacetum coccineum TaxID=301880 RepID=A0ABQ5E921_9ASTR
MYPTCRAACEALVSYPTRLWKRTWNSTSKDIPYTSSISLNIPNVHIDDSELEDYVLYELEDCLNHCSKSLADFGLRLPPKHLMSVLRNRHLIEEKSYDRRLLATHRDQLLLKLNDKQHHIFTLITDACFNNRQELVFVYGHGGTWKTFLWKTIIFTLSSKGKIVLAVASSGIAFLLLLAGRTAHSRFKIPLDPTDNTLQDVDRERVSAFAQWLLGISNENISTPDESDPDNSSWVDIPDEYCIPDDGDGISKLIRFIYGDETLHHPSAVKLQDKAIVCFKNDTADIINAKVLSLLSGRTCTYVSYDDVVPHVHDGGEVELLYLREYLNTLSFAGLPPHMLGLKFGTPIMLLRNINIVGGLCNGTCLIATQLLPKAQGDLDAAKINSIPITVHRWMENNETLECSICLGVFDDGVKVKVIPRCCRRATYKRLVDSSFKSQIGRNLEAYVEDMVIKSKTEKEMLVDIAETFDDLDEST